MNNEGKSENDKFFYLDHQLLLKIKMRNVAFPKKPGLQFPLNLHIFNNNNNKKNPRNLVTTLTNSFKSNLMNNRSFVQVANHGGQFC